MKRFFAWLWACTAGLLTISNAAYAREGGAIITIQSAPAIVVRDASKFESAEGVSLQAEDLIETTPVASLTRLELDDGTTVDLGPSTKIMLQPQWAPAAGQGGALVYVLEGWAKLTPGKPVSPTKAVVATAGVDVSSLAQEAVIHAHDGEIEVFAESGYVVAAVHDKGGRVSSVRLESGAFMVRHADGHSDVARRPAAAFVQAVPRAFMDTLPSRAPKFKGKDVPAQKAGRLAYADVESWLNAEPRIRSRFVMRWRLVAQDEAFRRPLMAQLPLHPEWRRVLAPPQPSPKAASAVTSAPASAAKSAP